MKKTVDIEDSLDGRVEMAIEEVKNFLLEDLDSNDPNSCPSISNLDFSGRIHEIIDGSVPVYYSEIRDIWYLHSEELEEAYEESGIGSNSRENDGMTAIYCLIEKRVNEWYDKNAEDIFDEWGRKREEK